MTLRTLTIVLAFCASSGCGMVGYGSAAIVEDGSVEGAVVDASVDASLAFVCPSGDCKGVFVTGAMPVASFGGVAEGDAICQALATANGLAGTWRAWLSDASSSPSTRFVQSTVPYRLLNGTLVANDYADLTDGTLAHAIDMEVSGAGISSETEVWTGTTSAGESAGEDCAGWSNVTDGTPYGVVGTADRSDGLWTEVYAQFCSRTAPRVYCFEQ